MACTGTNGFTPRRTSFLLFAVAILFSLSPSCSTKPPEQPSPSSKVERGAEPSGGARVNPEAEDGQWVMPAKNYASTRYSGLEEITADNVRDLKVAWTFSTGVNRGQEAAPIVVGDTMYVVTPYPNILYALDLKHSGALKWKYEPAPAAAAQGVACCDVVNRGAAFADGRIFYNTLDNHTVAVDAATGQQIWKTKLGDINKGESMTMAPLVVKGKVLVGNSGGEFGVRGWLAALNANDGSIAWRAYSTGPDADVLIGPDFKPFYKSDQGKDLGVVTWPPDHWKIGGGTVWGWISYDPELDLIYYGTANPGPWNPEMRPGDNKWTCGLFARRPDTGAAVWFYQFSPHDLHDWDGINEQILMEVPVNGQPRKVLVRPERNGYVYVMDRATGEVISANGFVHNTATTGVDLKTGQLLYAEDKKPKTGQVLRDICPAAPGAKDWNPSAFSPRTGLVYIPHNNLCMDFEGVEANYIAGTPYVGANTKFYAGPGGHRGEFTAWDPAAGRAVWKIQEKFPVWSGAAVTAGDVVFYGTMEGHFKAVHARTGELLWQFKTGSGIIGQPVVYRGPDGREYVAILSGVGGWAGAVVSGDLDTRDPSSALGFVNAMSDLPQHTTKGGTLYVFSLP
ncbi:MAG TPA: methanol/ethanol family PQQ-dependent dehydrogenase [Pyrinomonadaceae bacterium]|nr:methanol/ethanol family PQQ-dependent dehydrogenase [Pyrinomonadaceae bacterium]